MKKFKVVRCLILASIIITIGFFMSDEAQTSKAKEKIAEELVVTDLVSEWKTYHNEKWGYVVEYPANWSPEVSMKNLGGDEYVIKEKVNFSSQITIAVWTNLSELDLFQWFEKYRHWLAGEDAETTECTATVFELPAICVREPQTPQAYEDLKCFFQKENCIYRIKYTNSDMSQSLGIYNHMLSTFESE